MWSGNTKKFQLEIVLLKSFTADFIYITELLGNILMK